MAYSTDPHWALVHEPGLLLVHAGADQLFAIEDVCDAAAAEVLGRWRGGAISRDGLSQEADDVFGQLVSAGIICNLLEPRVEYSVALRFAGSRDTRLEAAVADALPAGIVLGGGGPRDGGGGGMGGGGGGEKCDLVLFVRTDGRLHEVVAGDYASLRTPHLLLDLAFDHTISVGPLVFARETAGLCCLAGRLWSRWGDRTPPSRPRVTEHPGLSGGLVAMTIANVLLRQDRSLVNRTVAYDFRAHEVTAQSVYRLPICPICGTGVAAAQGRIALPWAGAR